MINLPKITDLAVGGKRVLLRADLDVVDRLWMADYRLQALIPTLNYLKEKQAKIIVIGHRGRPGGVRVDNLSTREFQSFFDKWGAKVEENLRFNPGEEKNDPEFTRQLAGLAEIYINEAFAASHREHASIVGLPGLLLHAAGFRFLKEVENLAKVLEKPRRPLVFIIGGAKKDKLDFLPLLEKTADKVLVGGRLPWLIQNSKLKIENYNSKIKVANLIADKEDLTINSLEAFEAEITKAGTIVLAGPMGKYEDEGHRQGTERIFKAVANSSAFKVVGGGDSLVIIKMFDLTAKFDWVSVGGGAMLEFLAKGTLPGIEALK